MTEPTASASVRRISTGAPWEDKFGYSRAVETTTASSWWPAAPPW